MVQQKNIKKRSASESEVDKKKVEAPGIVNKAHKKKKTENGTGQNGQATKQIKADMPKKLKNEKKNEKHVTVPNSKKGETNEVSQEKNKKSTFKEEEHKQNLLQKRKEYREKRKANKEGKIHGVQLNLSVEDIKKKIAQIESRATITKSAKRKLASLRKRLRVEEGTEKSVPAAKKQMDNPKNEKSVDVAKKAEVQNNELKKKIPAKGENKLINKSNKKKQNNTLSPKQKVKKEEDEDDEEDDEEVDLDNEISEDEDESDVEADDDDEGDDDEEEDEEEEDEDKDEEEEDDDEDEDENGEEEKHEQHKESKVKISNLQTAKQKEKPKNIEDGSKKKRYVLFVGNLPYTITNEELKKHFLTKVSQVVDVRIPKKDANTARGFAYVELANNADYEKALSLNHSFINGRRINVQYSGENKKIGAAKNFKLHALQKAGKLAGGKHGGSQKFAGNRGKQNIRMTKT